MIAIHETHATASELHKIAIKALYDLRRETRVQRDITRAEMETFIRRGAVSREQAENILDTQTAQKKHNLPQFKKALEKARVFEVPLLLLMNLLERVTETEHPDNIDSVYFEPMVDLGDKRVSLLPFESVLLICPQAAAKAREENYAFRGPVGFVVTNEDVWVVHYIYEVDRFGSLPLFIGHCPYTDQVPEDQEHISKRESAFTYLLLFFLLSTIELQSRRDRVPVSLKTTTAIKKAAKSSGVKPIPNDYYVIGPAPESSLAEGASLSSMLSRVQNYCYDVIGWKTYRIMRGGLPLDEAYEKRLRKDSARTIVKCAEDLTPEIQKVLESRNIAYQEGMWLSILPYSVPSHQRNKDKPYVPAIRVVE